MKKQMNYDKKTDNGRGMNLGMKDGEKSRDRSEEKSRDRSGEKNRDRSWDKNWEKSRDKNGVMNRDRNGEMNRDSNGEANRDKNRKMNREKDGEKIRKGSDGNIESNRDRYREKDREKGIEKSKDRAKVNNTNKIGYSNREKYREENKDGNLNRNRDSGKETNRDRSREQSREQRRESSNDRFRTKDSGQGIEKNTQRESKYRVDGWEENKAVRPGTGAGRSGRVGGQEQGKTRKTGQRTDKHPYSEREYGRDIKKNRGQGETVQGKKSACPVNKECGGCKWLDTPYEEQLKRKQKLLTDLCGSMVRLEPIIGMDNPKHYRNKVHAVFGEDRKHNPISGIYEEKTHNIVPVDSCLLENQAADAIIVSIRKMLKSFKIRPYNEDTGYGLLRHVLIRTGHVSGQVMVVLVLASPILPSKSNFVKALLEKHPEITTIVINVNPRGTSVVLGNKEHVIYGKGYIEDTLCGMTFRISPRSFYQVNPAQTEKLYAKAIEYAGLTGRETVLDAYCGTGTIGLIASGKAGKVIGVELNADAVRDARINAKNNRVENIEFYQNDAGVFMTEMAEQKEKVDVVLMDPPRAGSDEAFLGALVKLQPAKVVYVSCNPQTLKRDMEYLCRKGYRASRGGGIDMFPMTNHVESIILMTKCGFDKK